MKYYLRKLKHKIFSIPNNSYIPHWIYSNFFWLDSKVSSPRSFRISIDEPFFNLTEKIDNKEIKWSFPKELRQRGRNCYLNGIKTRSQVLSNSYLLNYINFNDGDTIIDCGANFGDLWLYLHQQKKILNYHAIDPGKLEYKTITNNLNLNLDTKVKSKSYQYALSDRNGEVKVYYSPELADSSVIAPKKYQSEYNCESITLDKFITDYKIINKIKLFKLEAEGFEPEILNGAQNVLKNIEYITGDFSDERGVNENFTLPAVCSILYSNNFEMIEFNSNRTAALFKNKGIIK